MSSESVCQVASSCVDVDSFHTRLVVRFMIFIASIWNILNTPSYNQHKVRWEAHCRSATLGSGSSAQDGVPLIASDVK
jgi:hypothetical protein